MSTSKLRTLVLYASYSTRLSYYDDWIDAFRRAVEFDVQALNICQRAVTSKLKAEVREADLVVLLHSTNGVTNAYLEPIASILADRRGTLLSFVGNELNLPGSPISAKREILRRMGVDYIATQLPIEAGEYLWSDIAAKGVLPLPHALNPEAFRPETAVEDRPIDIGVRAARYLPHMGDIDRNQLHDLFERHEFAPALTVDINSARLNRTGWSEFLNKCKGTVSTEAGAWWLERDDATMNAIREWTASRAKGRAFVIPNDSALRTLAHKLPWQFRALLKRLLSKGVLRHEATIGEQMPFEEIHERFFAGRERPTYYAKCISSRHFDAIGTKTCQILLEGRYNDILRPEEHYIALERGFGNIEDVLRRFSDLGERRRIAEAARDHVMAHHTYDNRMKELTASIGLA